jgi:hypothetical protein
MSLAALAALCSHAAWAFPIETESQDFTLRWDNTLQYSNAFRLKSPSTKLTSSPNLDDGDRNFGKGLISNRVDILSEFDAAYLDNGMRISGSGWYDDVYNKHNDNNSPFTANQKSVPHDEFTAATRQQNGRGAQLLDAFVYTKGSIGEVSYNVRLGQHSVLYGETLFFGGNGIAGAQSPVDINRLLSVPDSQFKEVVLPQPQVSVQAQLDSRVSVGGYYQFRWHPDRLPPSGGYLSVVDLLQQGGERILTGPGNTPFTRSPDEKARNSGQGGLQLRWRPQFTEGEFGFYAAQFNGKVPTLIVHPVGRTYDFLYPNAIKTIGSSFSINLDDVNVAAELSLRHNQPLVAAGGEVVVLPGQLSDNSSHPRYPVGNTLHWNLSMIRTLSRSSLWEGGTFLAEMALNSRLSVQKNADQIDPGTTKTAIAMRAVFTPTYFQVLPGLDLKVPIGVGYNPSGQSSVITAFNGGAHHGGDVKVGLSGIYQRAWNISVSFTGYLGREGPAEGPVTSQHPTYTFNQALKDRNFIAMSISRTL